FRSAVRQSVARREWTRRRGAWSRPLASELLDCLYGVPVRLVVAELLERHFLGDGVLEVGPVDFGDGQTLILEELDQFLFALDDLGGRALRGFAHDIREDLLVLVGKRRPAALGDDGVEVIDDVAG